MQEVDWVYQQTRDSSKVLAVVGGLDLVKHDKMKEAIARFSRSKGPRFVGVRYLLVWDEEDYLTREDVHQGEETFVTFVYYLIQGLRILSDNGLTFDWHTSTAGQTLIGHVKGT